MVRFIKLDKSKANRHLPALFKILYDNMSQIAPTGNDFETDQKMWMEAIKPALEHPLREVILINSGEKLVGYFMYTVNAGLFNMEEIQFKPEIQGKGVFQQLYRYLFSVLPEEITTVEAYANRENTKSQGILTHLGLQYIGTNKSGRSLHYRGTFEDMKKVFGASGKQCNNF